MKAKEFILSQPEHNTVSAVCARHRFIEGWGKTPDVWARTREDRYWSWMRDYGIRVMNLGIPEKPDEPFVLKVALLLDTNVWDVTVHCEAIGYRWVRRRFLTEKGAANWLDRMLTSIDELVPSFDGTLSAAVAITMVRRFGFSK